MEVLLGLDFNLYQPQLILLEDKHLYLKKHFFLKQKGYKLVQRLNRNCWYIPKELEPLDFKTFKGKAWLLYGNEDEWLTDEKLEYEKGRALILFSERLTTLEFQGAHKLNTEALNKIIFNTTA